MRLYRAASFVFLAMIVSVADADTLLDGLVQHPQNLTAASLAALPPTEIEVAFQTSHGTETAHYEGVLLWTLVEQAGLAVEAGDPRNRLRHYLLISGSDDYRVAVAIGEIDPELEGKQAILAYARDGKKLKDGGLRVIIPGDKRGSRAVSTVVHIEVK